MGLELFKNGGKNSDRPVICIEVNPPRGVDVEHVLERLEVIRHQIDFFNVTDSALARMKCASLAFAAVLKTRFGIEPLVNLSCRDRNLIALQGDLLGAWLLGIRSVVALTGDAVTTGDFPDGKGVFEVNSVGLLDTIRKLNSGVDIVGNALKGAPTFVPGAVVNPNSKNPAIELRRLAKKVAAGASYALSQPIFEPERARMFFSEAQSIGIPLLVGLLPFRNARAGRAIAAIPGIRLSPALAEAVEREQDDDLAQLSISCCLEVADACRGVVRGFHIISGASPHLGAELVEKVHARV